MLKSEQIQEEDESLLDIIPRKKEVKKPTKANTYIQYLVESYEAGFLWDNKTLFKDRALLYMKANMLAKRSESDLKSILDWSRGKNVHPLVIVKLINTKLK